VAPAQLQAARAATRVLAAVGSLPLHTLLAVVTWSAGSAPDPFWRQRVWPPDSPRSAPPPARRTAPGIPHRGPPSPTGTGHRKRKRQRQRQRPGLARFGCTGRTAAPHRPAWSGPLALRADQGGGECGAVVLVARFRPW